MSVARLTGVLRVRKLQERRARGEVAINRRHLRDAEVTEQRTWSQLDASLAGLALLTDADAAADTDPMLPMLALRPATAVPMATVLGRHAVVTAGRLAAESQHLTTEAAADEVTQSEQWWTVAARRVEALERLSDRLEILEREERQRLAANEIDDLVLARFGRKTAGLGRNTEAAAS